ncbi:DNA circularization N-terminal domain-containing protein [Humitalea sp. 24SJ18S-53]|uniref:DNA circularization N-terminal domain-containing protein n=1 Tax=Humitalea sp. 24SJ18S-53 TaxID=3422307 RepID=UPI003D679A83
MSGVLGSLFEELFEGSFRDVEFHIADDSTESGRRVQRWMFPGRDGAMHQDIGGLAGRFEVSGLIIGDDYIRRAKAMERAFNTAGPGTLVHPWRGEIEAVLVEPCSIVLDEKKLRVATFRAVFERWVEAPTAERDTLGELLGAFDSLRSTVRGYLRRALAPVRMVLAAVAAVRGVISGIIGGLATLRGTALGAGGIFRGLLGDPLADLSALLTLPAASLTGDLVVDKIAAAPEAIGRAASKPDLPMIAPGGGAEDPAQILPPRVATLSLLDFAAGLAPATPGTPAAAVTLGTRALALTEAASATAAIDFASADDAIAWRDRLDAALAAGMAQAAAEAAVDPLGAAPVWRALGDVRRAVAADFNTRIGRLPRVAAVTAPPATVPAWIIANHLAGDRPGDVRAMVEDLVVRNRLAHPSIVPGGAVLEWLPPT